MEDLRKTVLSKSVERPETNAQSSQARLPQYDGPADEPDQITPSQHYEEQSASSAGSQSADQTSGPAGSSAESAPSQQADVAAGPLQSNIAAQSSSSPSGDTGPPYGIHPFPPPDSAPLASPPTPHIGPADTQSVASVYSPRFTASRRGLNPRAAEFDIARAFLNRGPGPQPAAPPEERDVGLPAAMPEQIQRRVEAAIYHLAMAYRYLSAEAREDVAERYDRMFEDDFGEAYTDERVRAIMEEDSDPPARPVQDQGEGDDGAE